MQKAKFIKRGETLVKYRDMIQQAKKFLHCESKIIVDITKMFDDLLSAYELPFTPFYWYICECDCGKKPMEWNSVEIDSLEKLWEVWNATN